MSNYASKTLLKDPATSLVIGNSETELQVSIDDQLRCGDARDMFVIAECSAVAGGAGTIKLQECHRKDGTYTDVAGATATITADGTFEIEINTIDGSSSALKPFIRILATTGAGDTFTLDSLMRTIRRNA